MPSEEIQLWEAWRSAPKEETLEPLLDLYDSDINRKVHQFRSAPVPDSAVRGHAHQMTLKALNSYKPGSGASLRTWVNWNLKKVRGFVVTHQNMGRIPEQRAMRIGDFKKTKEELTDRLGHVPDALTLSEALGPKWSLNEVTRMESELRPDLIASKSLTADTLDGLSDPRERNVLKYLYQDLSMDERLVFEYTLGVNGKEKLSAGDIATKLNLSRPKVSRIRKSIDKKMRERGI